TNLRELLKENNVPVYMERRLASVKKDGTRITEITMENGDVFRGKVFIDATYEGDLMARAGVKYMVGREANERFGETLNGIRAKTPHHQFLVPVDPYVKPGDPSSGLLPFVQDIQPGEPGAGDNAVQAYNFRLCLTKNPENKRPIEPPPGYDPKQYELLGRYFDALAAAGKNVTIRNFLKIDMVTPEKTDINNQGGFSTDFIGANYSYPEADYATREKIWKEHENYIRGFLTFLATDERVPEKIRSEMQQWGLPKDEFPHTGGWPHALYVREVRRMLGEYVMAEKNCRWVEKVEDPVGLGAYNMDSHNCRRLVRDGKAENEGDVQVGVKGPYGVSYRSIVPKADECENLLVPVALSATHIAYGSIRMEPVFMILGQSAATAASFALDDKVPVQKVEYAKLRARLLEDKQILEWTGAVKGQSRDHSDVTQAAPAAP
ncbi:MAG: FAD-dependent oxidoreductase, partial [Verrucomicrobiaceae bacterium]